MASTDSPYGPHPNSDSDDQRGLRQCKYCNCFSDSDERSHSPYGSTSGGSCEEECSPSGVSATDVSENDMTSYCHSDVDLENGLSEIKVSFSGEGKDCRICHLSLENNDDDEEESSGVGIELGCSCKDDLAAAHLQCAQTWFKIKGNTICEICGAIAINVGGEYSTTEANNASILSATLAIATTSPLVVSEVPRTCCHGHRILNFLIMCMVFAFAISWFFHFHVV